METRKIFPGIEMIRIGDARSSYVIRDEILTLIEAPYPSEAGELIQGLRELGIRPRDLKYFITTHIHLDHTGAAGYLVRENPDLIVFVHELGAPHLINPERLNQSVRKTYGAQMEEIGEMIPIPESRVRPVIGGDEIRLGKTRWQVIHTPGHARYHICLFEPGEKVLFTGDALGCLYPDGAFFIVTPAPDYDQKLSLESIRRLEELKPELIIFTHLGASRDKTLFPEARRQHRLWVEIIETVLKSTPDAGIDEFLKMLAKQIPAVRDFPQYPSYFLNIGGIKRYLEKQKEKKNAQDIPK